MLCFSSFMSVHSPGYCVKRLSQRASESLVLGKNVAKVAFLVRPEMTRSVGQRQKIHRLFPSSQHEVSYRPQNSRDCEGWADDWQKWFESCGSCFNRLNR